MAALRKNKKKRTATRRPYAGRTLVFDIIVMLKWRNHVASQRVEDFLEVYPRFSNKNEVLRGEQEKNPLFVWGCDRKPVCRDHQWSSLHKPRDANPWASGQIFLPPLTLMMDSYKLNQEFSSDYMWYNIPFSKLNWFNSFPVIKYCISWRKPQCELSICFFENCNFWSSIFRNNVSDFQEHHNIAKIWEKSLPALKTWTKYNYEKQHYVKNYLSWISGEMLKIINKRNTPVL